MTIQEFIQALKSKGIELNDRQLEQFEQYFKMLVEWNEKVNLTAILNHDEVYLKHFYDSIMPLWSSKVDFTNKSLIDIGAGAGFPSLPMLIINPTLQVTIIDSLNKRIHFLEHLVEALELENVKLLHGRAEDYGQDNKYRGQFDLVTARAVAQLNVLAEYCLPFAKKGGYFIALKGAAAEEEIKTAQKAISVLGAKVIQSTTKELPGNEGERTIITIAKTLDTPRKYPRRAGIPSKNPIKK